MDKNFFSDVTGNYCFNNNLIKVRRFTINPRKVNRLKTSLSKIDIINSYDNNNFSDSDLVIAKVVADNYIIHYKMLEDELKKQKNKTIVPSYELIKNRIDNLVKNEILYKYHIVSTLDVDKTIKISDEIICASNIDDSSKKITSYLMVTAHGYNFLKHVLKENYNYDEYIAVTPITEVLSQLSANFIKYRFPMYEYNFKSHVTFYNTYIKRKDYIYAAYEDQKSLIIIEPFKLTFKDTLMTKEKHVKHLINRLNTLNNYAGQGNRTMKNIRTVFVCDSLKDIKSALTIIKKKIGLSMPVLNNVYFTIDTDFTNVNNNDTFLEYRDDKLINKPFLD
jgi:hypothetical protein